MRVRIIFQLKNRGAVAPFHHQHLIAKMFDDMKTEIGSKEDTENMLCFSGIKGQTKVGKRGLYYFSSRVTIVVTSHDAEFLKAILKNILSKDEISLGELILIPEGIEKEKPLDYEEKTKYVAISPIIPVGYFGQNKSMLTNFLDPTSDEFSDYLYESTIARMESSGRFSEEEITSFYRFQVVPDHDYMTKLKRNNKKFSRIYLVEIQGEDVELRGYTLPLAIYAHPTVQQFIFECGFGDYTDKGYGLLDIANVNPLDRVESTSLD